MIIKLTFKELRGALFATAFILVPLTSISAPLQQKARSGVDTVVAVSMIHLLSDPKFFLGRKVKVFGYVGGAAGAGLYLTKDHAEAFDELTSIDISKPFEKGEQCEGHYAFVVGKVKIQALVSYSLVSLTNIESIQITDGPEGDRVQECYNIGD